MQASPQPVPAQSESPTDEPAAAPDWLERARVALGAGRLDEAVVLAWRAIELAPDLTDAHDLVARLLTALGRPEEALACERRAASLEPDDPARQAALADRLRRLGRPAEALALYEILAAARPDDPVLLCGLADCLAATGQGARALELNDRLIAAGPERPGLFVQRRAALAALGRRGEARRSFGGAIWAAAQEAADRRDWPAAIRAWQALLDHAPGHLQTVARLAQALRHAGRLDEAETIVDRFLAAYPTEPTLAIERAWIATARRDWPDAVARWQAIVAASPDRVNGWFGLAETLSAAGRFDEAGSVHDQALARFPGHRDLLAGAARTARRRGDTADSLRRLKTLEALHPDFPGIDGLIAAAGKAACAAQQGASTDAASPSMMAGAAGGTAPGPP